MVSIETIDIGLIRLDGDTQSRVRIDLDTVDAYAQEMVDGAEFPLVVAYFDGKNYWLADGFHRVHAALKLGAAGIRMEVNLGTARDALLHSIGANAKHGLRRSNEDKRKSVTTLLSDSEWQKWTDVKIAEACGVSNRFVGKIREELSLNGSITERFAERNGTVYPMRTENIGDRTAVDSVRNDPRAEQPVKLDHETDTDQSKGQTTEKPEATKSNPEVHHFPSLRALIDQEWVSITHDASTDDVGASILITMPSATPMNNGLKAFIDRAQKLNCGVYVTPNLQRLIVTEMAGSLS